MGAGNGPRARLLILALSATALWAGFSLAMGLVPRPLTILAANISDALRYGAWFAFLAYLLRRDDSAESSPGFRNAFIAVGAVLIASVLLGDARARGEGSL